MFHRCSLLSETHKRLCDLPCFRLNKSNIASHLTNGQIFVKFPQKQRRYTLHMLQFTANKMKTIVELYFQFKIQRMLKRSYSLRFNIWKLMYFFKILKFNNKEEMICYVQGTLISLLAQIMVFGTNSLIMSKHIVKGVSQLISNLLNLELLSVDFIFNVINSVVQLGNVALSIFITSFCNLESLHKIKNFVF